MAIVSTENGLRTGPATEFVSKVPDEIHQILLLQVASAQGLDAVIPGRSRRRVLLKGSRSEVQAAVNEAARLGLLLDLKCLEALEDLLQQKGLQVPLKLAKALMMAKVKVALAYGKISKLEMPVADSVPKDRREGSGNKSGFPPVRPDPLKD